MVQLVSFKGVFANESLGNRSLSWSNGLSGGSSECWSRKKLKSFYRLHGNSTGYPQCVFSGGPSRTACVGGSSHSRSTFGVVSFVRVDSLMDARLAQEYQTLPPLGTAVRSFSCMDAFMNLKGMPKLESLATMAAFVWCVTRVDHLVRLEVVGSPEAFVAV